MGERKAVKPRRMFAPIQDGVIWAEFAADTAKGARRRWCEGSTLTWEQWRKQRPSLRIIRVLVSPAPQ